MSDILDEFDTAVLEEAWRYIQEDDMGLADKIERAVKQGATPKELSKRFVNIAGAHRAAMAKRIENAAKYLQTLRVAA